MPFAGNPAKPPAEELKKFQALAGDKDKRDGYLQTLVLSLCAMEKVDTACTILNNVFPIDLPEKLDKINSGLMRERRKDEEIVQLKEEIGKFRDPNLCDFLVAQFFYFLFGW